MAFHYWKRNAKCIAGVFVVLVLGYITIGNMGFFNSPVTPNLPALDAKDVSSTCFRPELLMWPATIKKIYENLKKVSCDPLASFGYVQGGKFLISPPVESKYGVIHCKQKPIVRIDGDMGFVPYGNETVLVSGNPVPSDLFKADCVSEKGHKNTFTYLAVKPLPLSDAKGDRHKSPLETWQRGMGLDVLIFGFDSVSSLTWRRSLPKSHDFFANKLGGVLLEGYNIVGDGTPQALLPILTGQTEEELPEARRGFPKAKVVDDHPWIWRELKNRGYATQWGEDGASYGTFTYRMLGFHKQPVDHYMRTFYLAQGANGDCYGARASHQVAIDYQKEFVQYYGNGRRKFSFVFHSEYSHGGSGLLQNADNDLESYMRWLNDTGALDNTLLIMMSDHGARFTNLRSTEQGKYEERMPYYALRLPSSPAFAKRFPNAEKNLRQNAKILTTPFDIHETLMDVINYSNDIITDSAPKRPYPRGMSLFRPIPVDRMCSDAAIDNHWCTCMRWNVISKDHNMVVRSAEKLIEVINSLTSDLRGSCAKLELEEIKSALVVRSRGELLSFKQSKDFHGRVADLSDTMTSQIELYQIVLLTSPNDGLYESTVTYNLQEGNLTLDTKQISRLNKYGSQPNCVADKHPHLRAYCYCGK